MATWADCCDNCHRDVISRYQLLGGRICNACYSGLRRNPDRCPGCAEIRVLAYLDSVGARLCRMRGAGRSVRMQEQHLQLSTMDQAVIDRYFVAASSRDVLRRFLTWAAESGLCTRVEVPRVRSGPHQAAMSDEALAELAERVLADVALSPVGRLLALFAIVYAQPVRSSVELRLEAVERREGRVSIRFAATRVLLPATIAELLQEHLEQLEARGSYHPIANEWLFPGIMPGRHLAAGTGIGLLTRAGLSARALRTSRLALLSQTVPARVLADVIGISTQTAHARSVASGGTWQDYPHLRVT